MIDDEKKNAADPQKQDRPRTPTFPEFFSGLAGEVLIHLGYIENPFEKKRVLNLDLARYTLEIMAMLEEKTRGNLTDEEKNFVENILAELRLRYVDAVRNRQESETPGATPSTSGEDENSG